MPPRSTAHRLRPHDAGVSEVLGSILLTATAVVLLGGFGMVVLSSVHSTDGPPTGAFMLEAEEGAATATLRFVSGSSFPLDEARVVLLIDHAERLGAYALDAPATPGRFSPGDRLVMDVTGDPLAEGQRVTALVVDAASGRLVGSTVTTVLGPGSLPAFVTSAPTVASPALSPATLVADGRSLANLTVRVGATYGLDLVDRVSVDLTPLGGPVDVPLRDDGQVGDLLASDGTYTLQVAAGTLDFLAVPSTQTVELTVTVRDILGKTATTTATLTLQTPPQSKVSTGAKWRDLPPSDEVRYVNLTNVTLRDAAALGADQVQIRVSDLLDSSVAWTALVTFADPATCGGSPGVASIQLTRDGVPGSVTYTPNPGPCFSLSEATHLNLADVPSSRDAAGLTGTWTTDVAPGPYLYSAAGLSGTNEATVTFLGDSVSPSPGALGLAQADLIWARIAGTSPSPAFTATANLLVLDVDASASTDPQGEPLQYAWDWGDGATTPASGSPTATHTYATAGNYVVTLTVTDPGLLAGVTTRTIPINRNPVASFAHTTSDLTLDVTSTSTDPDGHALAHAWEWGDGSTGTGATATHAYATAGTYAVNLTVTDTFGAINRTSASVTLSAGNAPPTASLASNVTGGPAPLAVELTLGGADADGAVASWTLSYGDGGTASGTTLPATLTRTYATDGAYRANLTVTDDEGAVAGASVNLTVSTNQAPTAGITANRTSGHAPMDVQLTLSGSDPDGSVASWSLSWGDGATTSGTSLPTARTHQYVAGGTYLANLTVTDDLGATRTASVTLTANARPVASLAITGSSGLRVDASGAGSTDADGSVAWYNWDWGDGTTSNTTTATATHEYAAAGTYTVSLTVIDDLGAASAAPATATATAATAPAAPQSLGATAGNRSVTLTWSAPASDGGSPVTGYHVYAGTTSGATTWLASLGTNTTFTVHGLTNGQTYVFNVTAQNAVGQGASSAEVNATPATVPEPPASLTATAGAGEVSLAWTPGATGGSPITGYQVHRGTTSGSLTLLATVGTNASYVDQAVTNGVTYHYHVRAVNAIGVSNPSVERNATPTSTVDVNCSSMSVTSGTVSSCAALQFADLTYATFEESGGTPPRLFQASFSLNVSGLTGSKTLQFNGYRGNAPEDLHVQVWNATSGAWETKITMPASTTSATTFEATVHATHHFSGGVFRIRLIDPNTLTGTGSDSNFSSWLVDYVRLVAG